MPERVRPQPTRTAASASTAYKPGRAHAGSCGRSGRGGAGAGRAGAWSAGAGGRSVKVDMDRSIGPRAANPVRRPWEEAETAGSQAAWDPAEGRSAVAAPGVRLGLDYLEVLVEQDGDLLARRVHVDLVRGPGVLGRILGRRGVDRRAGHGALRGGRRLGEGVAGERLLVGVPEAVAAAMPAAALAGRGREHLERAVLEDRGARAVGLGDVHLIGCAGV